MLKEFKTFITRGSVVDLAIGVVIGAAFGAIVSSLVKDILMPPIGLLLGNVDFLLICLSFSKRGRRRGPMHLWQRLSSQVPLPSTMACLLTLLSVS